MPEEVGMMRNKPYVIVLTGGIATGKSTVSEIIKQKGYTVLDSDKIVHKLYTKGEIIYNEIVRNFGKEILNENNEIDRKKLGKIVFNNSKLLSKLNKIVHREVSKVLIEGINICKDKMIFLDIPLFIEQKDKIESHGLEYDEIWLVYINRKLQISRLLERDKRGYEESIKIINSQMNIEDKIKYADEIIRNEGSLEQLKERIQNLLNKK